MAIGTYENTSGQGPAAVVQNHVDIAHDYANEAFVTANAFLDALATFTAAVQPIDDGGFYQEVLTPSPDFVIPPVPVEPNISPVVVTIPDFTPTPVDATFDDIGDAPEFTTPDPVLNLPATPDELNVDEPGSAPNITTNFDFPDAPSSDVTTLPDAPTFEELEIPEAPSINIGTFSEDLPDSSTIGAVPGNTFSWSETFYTDDLLERTSAELLDRIQNGGTGLNPVVEQAIWDRARNREDKNAVRSAQQLIKEQAGRGFSRPTGALTAGLDMLAQETQNKNADLSREIAIKQAELEQENLKFSLQSAIQLEGQLLSYSNSVQQRAFEAERVTVELGIELYKARVAQFQAEVDVYRAYADAFESQVRAELAKVQIFESQIKAQGLINDINDSRVRLYVAQIDGIRSAVDVYKTQIDAVNSRIQSEGLKIENYKSEIDAYTAQVGAKRDEYAIYGEQVKAELAKVSVYEAQARAFASRIQAYSANVDAEAKKVDARIENSRTATQAYIARVDGLIKQAQANQLQVTSAIDIYRGQAEVFRARLGAEEARVDAESKVFDIAVREATAQAEIAIKNAEIALANADNIAKLQLEAIKSGATVSAQLAASSLSAMNIGATISGNETDYHYYEEK